MKIITFPDHTSEFADNDGQKVTFFFFDEGITGLKYCFHNNKKLYFAFCYSLYLPAR